MPAAPQKDSERLDVAGDASSRQFAIVWYYFVMVGWLSNSFGVRLVRSCGRRTGCALDF